MATARLCSIEACGKRVYGHGLCSLHWQRWRRWGDPLFVKKSLAPRGDVQTFFRDTVLNHDQDECLIWPFARHRGGYGHMRYKGRDASVCRLVCEHVYGPPPTPGHKAAHSCGKGHEGCCSKRHLRWATPTENEADKLGHGTDGRGERHSNAKLSADDVRAIRALRGQKPLVKIAAQFGVCRATISGIYLGISWNSVQ